jgi:hypothetical protein
MAGEIISADVQPERNRKDKTMGGVAVCDRGLFRARADFDRQPD